MAQNQTLESNKARNVALVNSYAARLGMNRTLHRSQAELIQGTGRDARGEIAKTEGDANE
jgi:hypothetical protein